MTVDNQMMTGYATHTNNNKFMIRTYKDKCNWRFKEIKQEILLGSTKTLKIMLHLNNK